MRAVTTGSWYTLRFTLTLIAFIAIALPLAHFNSEMRGLGGNVWDALIARLSRADDIVAWPIATVFGIRPSSELYPWIKAMIPIDLAILLWILPDPSMRRIKTSNDSAPKS